MRKKFVSLTLSALLLALCVSAEAQQPEKVPRIGYLSNRVNTTTPDLFEDAFRQGLRDLGYVDGKNILIDYRYAEGSADHLPGLAAELIQLKVDVLVSATIRGIRAAKQATKTIPIVMVTTADPVAAGLVDSLARPGGNITGLTRLTRDLSGKRLKLLKESLPGLSRVGIVWGASSGLTAGPSFTYYEAASRALKIHLVSIELGPDPDSSERLER